jgi:hypothetical protein
MPNNPRFRVAHLLTEYLEVCRSEHRVVDPRSLSAWLKGQLLRTDDREQILRDGSRLLADVAYEAKIREIAGTPCAIASDGFYRLALDLTHLLTNWSYAVASRESERRNLEQEFVRSLDALALYGRECTFPGFEEWLREIANSTKTKGVKLFYSYAHEDEVYRNELSVHLAVHRMDGLVSEWHDRVIRAGEDWNKSIDAALTQAEIILFLVSPDFLASNYIHEIEMRTALRREAESVVRIVPIILRPCAWNSTPLARFQVLPRDGKPVTTYNSRDTAWLHVSEEILAVIREHVAQL